ncbi:hypothetical protein [Haloferax sp. YSSS75]|uniref:hypothetical protein n=1 Tax=Haloferax sp. YSSS75 TaxID=3388564 RepID=UPI00398D1CA9
MEFVNAETREQLSRAEGLLEVWLQTHTKMWKTAVEHDSLETLKSLRQLLSDIYYLGEGEYAVPYQDTELGKSGEDEPNFSQYKQRLADSFRRRLTNLQFAAYAWGFFLSKDGNVSDSTLHWMLIKPITEDFGSVQVLSEVYFRMRDARGAANSWEQWNMSRELDRNFGVATTAPATSSWLLSFYCSALVWVATRTDWSLSDNGDPQNSPALKYADHSLNIDPIRETLKSYNEEYPLESFLDDYPVVEGLIGYFDQVQETFKQQEREWTRIQPIDKSLVKRFAEKANSRLNDSTFRAALTNSNKITEVDNLDDEDTASFDVTGWYPRRLFVETGISTVFSDTFSPVLTRYREFVIDQLQLPTQRVASYNRLPEKLDDIIAEHDAELIITGDSEAASILRNHEKSNRTSHEQLWSYLEYSGTPVLNDVGAEFLTLVLFEAEFKYKETSTGTPLSIDYTAGEDVQNRQDTNSSSDTNPSDWVKFTLKYEAAIQSEEQPGIVLTL